MDISEAEIEVIFRKCFCDSPCLIGNISGCNLISFPAYFRFLCLVVMQAEGGEARQNVFPWSAVLLCAAIPCSAWSVPGWPQHHGRLPNWYQGICWYSWFCCEIQYWAGKDPILPNPIGKPWCHLGGLCKTLCVEQGSAKASSCFNLYK